MPEKLYGLTDADVKHQKRTNRRVWAAAGSEKPHRRRQKRIVGSAPASSIECGFAKLIGALKDGDIEIGDPVPGMKWVDLGGGEMVLRVGVAIAVPMIQAGLATDWTFSEEEDPESEDFEGFEIDNMCGDQIASGKYVQWKTMPNGRKFIDAASCFDPELPA